MHFCIYNILVKNKNRSTVKSLNMLCNTKANLKTLQIGYSFNKIETKIIIWSSTTTVKSLKFQFSHLVILRTMVRAMFS